MVVVKGYYDGSDIVLWLVLNKVCKDEIVGGKCGVNCFVFEIVNIEVNKMICVNLVGFVGVCVNFK